MSFHVTHRTGAMEPAAVSSFPSILSELETDRSDSEHGSVSVTHDSEWCLSVQKDGYVVFENIEEGEPRHMRGVSREKVLSLWQLLAEGHLDAIESEPWHRGY